MSPITQVIISQGLLAIMAPRGNGWHIPGEAFGVELPAASLAAGRRCVTQVRRNCGQYVCGATCR